MNPPAGIGSTSVTASAMHKPSTADEWAADRACIAAIRARIEELEARDSRPLQEEMDSAQGRLDSYTYPVLTLPNEIMSEIFVHFLPVYPKRPPLIGLLSPALLGQICRKWREIALSTPELWRAVTAYFHRRKRRTNARIVHLLENFLERSGCLPLSIKLEHGYNWPQCWIFIQAIASKYRLRCEHLEIYIAHYSMNEFIRSFTGLLPLLQTMKIYSVGEYGEVGGAADFAWHTAPLLRTVALQRYYEDYDAMLPWSQLTVLIVNDIDWVSSKEIFHWAVNLVYCKLGITYHRLMRVGEPQSLNLILPHLETLVLSIGTARLPWPLIDTLNLPALRSLQVKEAVLSTDPVAALVSLMSRSNCDLQELRIVKAQLPHDVYRKALPSVGSFIFDRQLDVYDAFLEEWDYHPESDSDEDFDSADCEIDSADEGSDSDAEYPARF
ncbi:hypothetical protein C8R44DRAFT_872182 [Mycena epipterygia]|nr:hypothetical protein C8R44DRAFT_872182 [Mycena epipterygia]